METASFATSISLDESTSPRVARMGDRVIATFLDGLIIIPIFWLIVTAIAVADGVYKDGNASLNGGPALLAITSTACVWILYHTLSEYLFSGTPGKLVMGIGVSSAQYMRITLAQAIIRNILRPIDIIGVYLLGFIVALCTHRRQRIGDLVARTIVIEQSSPRRMWALAIFAAIFVSSYGVAFLFQRFAQ